MIAIIASFLMLIPAQAPGQGKGKNKKKNAGPPAAKEIEDIDPEGRFEGGIIDQAQRYFLWYDDGEWRLRTGSTNVKTSFTGSVKVKNGTFASWHGAGLDKGKKNPDFFRINNDRTELSFTFTTSGRADGVNFKTKGDNVILEFNLTANGKSGPRVVRIGKEKQSPSAMPFRLKAPDPAAKPKKESKGDASK
jgi:hypothetical protein